MKTKISILVVALLVSVSCYDATAQTVTSFRWLNSTEGSLTDSDGANIAVNGSTILTFLAPSAFDLGAAIAGASGWSTTFGTATFYEALPNAGAGRLVTSFMTETQPDDFAVGQVAYAVALDLPFVSFTDVASIPLSTHYGVAGASPTINNLDTSPAGTAQSFTGFSIQTTEVIPEPGTMAFLVLGVLTLGARRYLRTRRED